MSLGKIVVLLVLALGVAGCAAEMSSEVADRIPLADTQWDLARYTPTGSATLAAVPGAVRATANFTGDQISGNAGCNAFTGTYSTDGSSIETGPIATTSMACAPDVTAVEDAYLARLASATTYSVTTDTLMMGDADGVTTLRFTAATPTELVGTTWRATGINNGHGGVTSLIWDTTVTAVFGADEKIAGSSGCNRYTGPYRAGAGSLEMGDLATTRRACPRKIGEQESRYLAALGETTTYTIDRDTLELRDPSGALQVSFVADPVVE